MNKRYLALVLISMTLLFASVQAFDYFEWDKQLFPTYDGTPKPETTISLSPASSCSATITGTPTTNCTACASATTCCNFTAGGCEGTNTASCTAGTPTACNAAVCCAWVGVPPAGYCDQKACADISDGDCETCSGCDIGGGCSNKTCTQVAATSNNPDVCAGCNTCPGNWTIDNARGTLPWDVDATGRCDFLNGATMSITSGEELTCNTVRFYTTSYCRVYTGGSLRST